MAKTKSLKQKKSYHHGNLFDNLITETMNIIKKHGVKGVSLRKLAEKCSVSSMALYRHFPNKEALIIATLKQGCKILYKDFLEIHEKFDGDVIEKLKALGFAYIDFAIKYRNYFYLMNGDDSLFNDNAELNKQIDIVFQFLKSIIKEGMDNNMIVKQDLETTAFAVWSYIHGMTFLFLQGRMGDANDPQKNKELINQMLDYFYIGFKP